MSTTMDRTPDWDAHQPVIEDLYWHEGKELPEVMRIMEDAYGFVATRKQYKKQLKAWGYEKNIKAHEMIVMLQIQKRRLEEEGKVTEFIRRGRVVPAEKLARFRKRYKITELDETHIIPNERATTPDDITYRTPEPETLESPLSATSDKSGEPDDDRSLDEEGDSTMFPALASAQVPVYGHHSPTLPRAEEAWLSINDPFNYAQVSSSMSAEFSGMAGKVTPNTPSGFHTNIRNDYSDPLSPSTFAAQTQDPNFGPIPIITHNLGHMDTAWNLGFLPQEIRPSVSVSPQEPSRPLGEQYFDYPVGPPTQQNMSWASSCPQTIPKSQGNSSRQISPVVDRSRDTRQGYSPVRPLENINTAASVLNHVAPGFNPTLGALAAFRNCSPLHCAVIRGDVDRVRTLLVRGDDPSPVALGGITPLHLAAFQRSTCLINLLREHGAKLDAVTNCDQSVLFFAVCNPDRLKCGDKPPQGPKVLADLPVHRTDDNTVDTINALFDCPVGWIRLLRIVDKADDDGTTPLMAAAEEGFIRTATLLLQRGARPEKKDKASYTALRYAARLKCPELARLLLKADTRIQDRDLSHMLKLVTRNLPTARFDTDRRASFGQGFPHQPRDSHCEGSAAVLGEMARVYREMDVLAKLISLAEQQELSPRVVEYLTSVCQLNG
ncbi:hypothetical protein QBC37DRAFT_125324 [Rhypophila decipiens]|uniref:Clr5 domain-containing protein n=1 Tax=Rhypophila decipiens TaxID=261697 RepID=A0AAN6YF08_9PEZI|nr:hypothetical protein QBC37DRAFT_125324 [Rhypophila decipiens]